MAPRILYRRPEPREDHVRAGLAPSSGVTWAQAAHLANWTRGRGAVLVPGTVLDRTIASGTTEVFRFRVKTRTAAIQHVVVLWLRAASAGSVLATIASPSGGTAQTYAVTSDRDLAAPIIYTRNLAVVSGAEQEISVSITAAGGNVIADTITIREQDRAVLAKNTSDYGVDPETEMVRQPIRYTNHESYRGIVQTLANLDARRVGIIHVVRPDTAPMTRTSATPLDVMGLPVAVLARKVGRAETTGRLKWSVYAKMSAAGTGNVKLTTTESGVNDVMPVTSTTYAWTTPREIDVHCEDLDSEDGRQVAGAEVWDRIQFAIYSNGVQTLSVASISVWDDYGTNLLPEADAAGWAGTGATPGTVTSGQADPFGGTDAHLLIDDRVDATEALRTSVVTYTSGDAIRVGLWVKVDAAPTAFVGIRLVATDSSEIALNLASGAAQVIVGSAISDVSVQELVSGWWFVSFVHSGDASTQIGLRVHPARGSTYPTATAAAVGNVTVYGPSIVYANA